jgi:cysteine desulfurase / selenocysteine lyase
MDTTTIRPDFPILNREVRGKPLIYLDNAATSQKPQSVIDALVDYYQHHNANVHRGIHTLGDESTQAYQAARQKIAQFIGSRDPHELIFVRNTTEAINLVAFSWALKNISAGDEIIVTELEHHSNLVTWQRVCQQTGAKLLFLPIDGNGDLSLEYLKDITGKHTKLIALTHVSNTLGTIINIKHLARDLKHQAPQAKIILDAAQSIPHMSVNVSELNVDFVAFSGHKMLGPMGIGGLWFKKELLETMDPFLVGGGMISQVTKEGFTWADLPDRFDAGTPNVAGAVGLAAAVDYLNRVGMVNIHEHEQMLVEYGLAQLQQIEEEGIINLYGLRTSQKRAGILTFNVLGVHAHDTAQILDREFGIAVRSGHHCNQILVEKLGVPATVRASFYLYNIPQEIDILIEGLRHVKKVFT